MTRTDVFTKEVKDVLENNILKFWLRLRDPRGGFYGQVDGEGKTIYDAPRGAILNARLIWTFSVAYRKLKSKEYLIAAAHAKDYFMEHFMDHKFGGVYWSVDADGNRLETKAQLYSQAFAIYALSEYYRAFKDEEALKAAVNIYDVVEKEFFDPQNNGYVEAKSRDFQPLDDMRLSDKDVNAQKTMNSHLHLLEAYANLYKVWPEEKLRERVINLLTLLCSKIVDNNTGHLKIYFDAQWNEIPAGCSYGHDIETSWLALECANAIKDIDVINVVKPLALKMYHAGMEGMQEDGSFVYAKGADGTVNAERQWWVMCEGIVGNLWAWKYQNVPSGADAAMRIWKYTKTHLVDFKNDEWFWGCTAEGEPDTKSDKAGFWKCPYHNSRMCLQVLGMFD